MNLAISRAAQFRCLLIVFITATLFACGNKSKLENHIPKQATVVVKFDLKSMALKSVSFKEVFTLENLKKAVGSIGAKQDSTVIGNPGLDFTSDVYIFGITSASEKYGAILANLSDAKLFEAFLKASNSTVEITEDAALHMKFASLGMGLIGFDDKSVYGIFGDSSISKDKVMALVNLKAEESLGAVSEPYKASLKEKGDISFWVDLGDIMKMVPQYSAAMAGSNFSDTYASAVVNFEDGQVVVDGSYTTNEEMAEKGKILKGSVGKDIAKTLPGQNIIGVLGFALDMDKIYAELEKQNLIASVDPSSKQLTGLSVKEVMGILSGDVAMSLNGLKTVEAKVQNPYTGESMTSKQTEADYTAIIGLTDKSKMQGLLDKFSESGMLTKGDKFYNFQNKTFVAEHKAMLVVTSSEARIRSILDGSVQPLGDEDSNLLASDAYVIEFDPANISEDFYSDKTVLENVKNSEVIEVILTGTAMSGKTSKGKFVVKFKEKGENSLVTIGRISKKFKSMTPPMSPAMPADSTAAPSM